MNNKQLALQYLDGARTLMNDCALDIWNRPEIALTETFASQRVGEILEEAGFDLKWNIGGMPTAFVASWGTGGPKIGILGEYDALPGLSQHKSSERSPVVQDGAGHGCGHNLFGTASMGAAIAVKTALELSKTPGTIKFYGCPAEETLVGKTYMARDKAFDELDAVLAWHPSNLNTASIAGSLLALNSFRVNFYGVAAHAGAVPHLGRSALDGCMLMDVGVNYLREHIIPEARIHSVITRGGQAPNIVPAYAQIWYFVRAPKREQVEDIYKRVLDIAKGAALMSGTTHDIEFVTGCYDLLNNRAIGEALLDNMKAIGGIKFDPEDFQFAAKLRATVSPEMMETSDKMTLDACAKHVTRADIGEVLCEGVMDPSDQHVILPGSSEVGDVSHIAPTGNMVTACFPHGTPGHSWQLTAAVGSGIGLKGMQFAAQTLATTALDLIEKPELLNRAKAEFAAATKDKPYQTPLPPEAKPR